MPDLYSDFVFGQVNATINSGDTSATLDDVSSFPSSALLAKADFYVTFDGGLTHPNAFEIVKVTNVDTTAKTVTFTPASVGHPVGTMVKGTLTAGMLRRLRAGLSGTVVPAADSDLFSVGDRFYKTDTNTTYVYGTSGFAPLGGGASSTAMNYRGAWASGTSYAVSDVVTYANKLYVCTVAVTASSPSFIGATTTSFGTTAGGNAPLPAGAATGDIVVMAIAGAQGSYGTVALPSGSTSLYTIGADRYAYKVLTSTDIANGYLTLPTQVNTYTQVTMHCFRNISGVDTGNAKGATSFSTSTTTLTGPAYLYTAIALYGGAGTLTQSSLTGLTYGYYASGAGNIPISGAGYEVIASPGTSTSRTFTWSGGQGGVSTLVVPLLTGSFQSNNFVEIGATHDSNGRLQAAAPSTAGDVAVYGPEITPVVTSGVATYQALSTDSTVLLTSSFNAVTTPTVPVKGMQLTVKNTSTNTSGSITAASSGTIDGSTLAFPVLPRQAVTLQYDGTGWWVIYTSGQPRQTKAVSTATTASAFPFTDYLYLCSGTMTLTLPTAVGNQSKYTVKNTGTGVITIATTSSQTMDGATTTTLSTQYQTLNLISDGTNWWSVP